MTEQEKEIVSELYDIFFNCRMWVRAENSPMICDMGEYVKRVRNNGKLEENPTSTAAEIVNKSIEDCKNGLDLFRVVQYYR